MAINSIATTPTFQFTLVGQIESDDGLSYLVCADGTRLRVVPAHPECAIIKKWLAIPSIDSTSLISNVRVLNGEWLDESELQQQDLCQFSGRVVELGKRQDKVLFKVARPEEKTLKLTLLNPDPRMRVGEMWSCTAVRVGATLKIINATCLDKHQSNPRQDKKVLAAQDKKVLPAIVPPTSLALAALVEETGSDQWQFLGVRQRALSWEWEALSSSTRQRARVQICPQTQQVQVYQYPSPVAPATPVASSLTVPPQDNQRLVVTPLGAAMGIGASCFQVKIGPYEVVLDCGTRPKGDNPLPALEHLHNPDLLLISHAHQDHIGAVPVFHNRWSGVRMICTLGTREIAHIMLQDCLKVQQANEDSSPLFNETDLQRTLFHLETEPIGQDFEPLPGLVVRFINAGHIVGAACIYLRYAERSLLYTGDYNTTSSRTTTGLQLAELPQAEMLITEATYGADIHPARQIQESALLKAIAAVVKAGGNVLIPAFALGRAQEILLALRTSAEFQKLGIPVYVDGLVRAVTDTFREHLELLPQSVQNLVSNSSTEPFFDQNSQPVVIPIAHPRERPLAIASASVIVASSGMLSGGASVYYAKVLLERENAAIFISGYTDEESPGRLLQNLQTGDTIELDGTEIKVRSQIKRFNLSAHADKIGLTQVIAKVNPKHLVLVHGSLEALHQLSRSGDLKSKHYIHIARVGEPIEFGVVPSGVSAKQLARINSPQEFEVEVTAEVEGAWIHIPESVVAQDPRWQMLAGKGVMQARWDGLTLKLSPVDEQQLAISAAVATGGDCCANCQHFELKTSRCLCLDSPLSERVVDPAGYCLEYAALASGVTQDETLEDWLASDEDAVE